MNCSSQYVGYDDDDDVKDYVHNSLGCSGCVQLCGCTHTYVKMYVCVVRVYLNPKLKP